MRVSRYRIAPLLLFALLIVLVLAGGLWLISARRHAGDDYEYFPQIQHNVRGEFLKFFRENGELEIFGFPMTEAFLFDGRIVQYFQRARMELHPENEEPNRVRLSPLADELAGKLNLDTGPMPEPLSVSPGDPSQRHFPETGHAVGEPFLRYFDAHGGVRIFGNPITEAVRQEGRLVQYFQNMRLDYYPERPSGQQVQPADLGDVHFLLTGMDPGLRKGVKAIAAATPGSSAGPAELRLDAHVARPYAASPEQQVLHVYVTDQDGHSVENAAVEFTVQYPGSPRLYKMPLTNEEGHTSMSFPLEPIPAGQKLMILVTASSGAVAETMLVSSLPWR